MIPAGAATTTTDVSTSETGQTTTHNSIASALTTTGSVTTDVLTTLANNITSETSVITTDVTAPSTGVVTASAVTYTTDVTNDVTTDVTNDVTNGVTNDVTVPNQVVTDSVTTGEVYVGARASTLSCLHLISNLPNYFLLDMLYFLLTKKLDSRPSPALKKHCLLVSLSTLPSLSILRMQAHFKFSVFSATTIHIHIQYLITHSHI